LNIERADADSFKLVWPSSAATFYVVRWTPDFRGAWKYLDGAFEGTGGTNSVPVTPAEQAQFFQLVSYPSAVALTATDDGKQITLPAGSLLKISLAANPSTGFAWQKIGGDESVLVPIGNSVYQGSGGGIGSGGTSTFWFAPGANGTTTLQLVYRQAFVPNVPPAQTFSVTVTVSGG